ncbi:MAG TPA: CRISPR-associated endonuclease Cas3'', partial [Isosphaeraceae bacterium]
MPERHYAHTLPDAGVERWQPLADHLGEVAHRAEMSAAVFDSGSWGALAGLWHDLGKYADDFQAYLRSSAANADVGDASVEDGRPRGRVDHSTAGAVLVRELCGERLTPGAAALALAIAGHHGELPRLVDFEQIRLASPEKRARLQAAREGGAPADLLGREIPRPPAFLRPESLPVGGRTETMNLRYDFWTRMLFSTLIDADRLDTESFMDEEKGTVRARHSRRSAPLDDLLGKLDENLQVVAGQARGKIAGLAGEAVARAEAVLDLRAQVLSACRMAAETAPGKFSLTVPTGGGKTLAALAFALTHAIRHGLRRVIVVIPFTSIIDQTARVYREAFGELGRRSVVEHHSNLDQRRESVRNRLASENWDAPVVVTTSVQFFESLFASRGTALRKLHNIARSVVVFDEVQTLPHHLRAPIFDALNQLVDHYKVS